MAENTIASIVSILSGGSKRFPLLHQKGSDGRYYTQEQVRELVEYAADRGIRVIPEIGLPGHCRSRQIAYPKLAVDPELKQEVYSGKAFSSPIDPIRDEVYGFISELIKEMVGLFPDAYMHMGGDEVTTSVWTDSGSISAFMDAQGMEHGSDLQAYFSMRYAEILKRNGKTAIGWDEVLHSDLTDDVVVHLWRGTEAGKEILDHPVLLSTNYYLDHVRLLEYYYRNDPLDLPINGVINESSTTMSARGSAIQGATCSSSYSLPLPSLLFLIRIF